MLKVVKWESFGSAAVCVQQPTYCSSLSKCKNVLQLWSYWALCPAGLQFVFNLQLCVRFCRSLMKWCHHDVWWSAEKRWPFLILENYVRRKRAERTGQQNASVLAEVMSICVQLLRLLLLKCRLKPQLPYSSWCYRCPAFNLFVPFCLKKEKPTKVTILTYNWQR